MTQIAERNLAKDLSCMMNEHHTWHRSNRCDEYLAHTGFADRGRYFALETSLFRHYVSGRESHCSELIRAGHSGHITLITSSHRSSRSRNFLGRAYSELFLRLLR
jgi:hypothetical protein